MVMNRPSRRPVKTAAHPSRASGRGMALIASLALAVGIGLTGALPASAETANDSIASPAPETPAPATPDAETSASDEAVAEPAPADTTEPQTAAAPPAPVAASEAAPASIPVTPPAGSAVISVKVGGDRLSDGTVKGLAGVTLGLYGPGTPSANGNPVDSTFTQGLRGTRYNAAWAWTTCVSDADGDCNFIIPIRASPLTPSSTGAPQDTRFWIVEESAPSGWYANPSLRVGSFGATPDRTWEYRFRTDTQLRAGTVYQSTAVMPWNTTAENIDTYFMRNRLDTNLEESYSSNATRTTGVWSQSRVNPVFPAKCGIDVAIIADTSGSLGDAGIASLKSTMSAFVDAFRGTDSRMSLFSFSNLSPGAGADGPGGTPVNFPTLLPVSTAAQGSAFKAQFAGWDSGGGTNWDAGFAAAANAPSKFDLAILLTDGNPTVIRNNANAGSSAYNSLQDTDAGIFSANQLKAKGTRVVAVGVGSALTSDSELNLRAVSGTTAGSDYLRAVDFAAATTALTALATANCQGSIAVQKLIVPTNGTISDATPAPAGWQFDAVNTTSTVTVNSPASQTTTSTGQGKVQFGLTFGAAQTSGDVRILETQQLGFLVVPVGVGAAARNAVCTNLETGLTVPVTNAGTAAQPGFTVTGLKSQRVECKIYNRAPAPGALIVEKSSNPTFGSQVTPGQVITYTLTFRNTGGLPVAVDREDILSDVLDDAVLNGSITAQTPLTAALTPAGDRIRITGSLPAGATSTVTYAVKVKDPLPATANGTLRNVVVPTGETPPTTCLPNTPCTVHPVVVTLAWSKVSAHGDLLAGSEWTLTPYNARGQLVTADALVLVDCVAATAGECTGRDTAPQAGKFLIVGLKPGKYQLAETKAPAGYQRLAQPVDLSVDRDLAYGNIVNTQITIPPIPLTGGTGSLIFLLAAGGLGGAALIGVLWQRRRSRRSHTSVG